MLVKNLLVEGELDGQLLHAVCGGHPLVIAVKSLKNSLAPRTRIEREKPGGACVFYLRDRDFDYEPPGQLGQPIVDKIEKGTILGWRWCRHSIENYMLEPAIVCAALQTETAVYRPALQEAGDRIKYYQAARWAIGLSRQALPPHYELDTGLGGKKDFFVPEAQALTQQANRTWVLGHVKTFLDQVETRLDEKAIAQSFEKHVNLFETHVCDSAESLLIYFSGKDLMIALEPWWRAIGIQGANDFRGTIRDWMMKNPEEILVALPEWQALLHAMRQ